MALASVLEVVVGVAGDAPGLVRVVHGLRAGAGERENGLVDSRVVHRLEPERPEVEQPLADEVGALGLGRAIEAPEADRALVGAPFLHQPQNRVELLLGGEGFLGGDAQVAPVAAGPEVVSHEFSRKVAGQMPCLPGDRMPLGSRQSLIFSAKRRWALLLKS